MTVGAGLPLQTGLGPNTNPATNSANPQSTGILGFGFPPPFVDPLFFNLPNASSFFLNRLLGAASGQNVPINFGQAPATLGLQGFLLGQPFFGGGPVGGAATPVAQGARQASIDPLASMFGMNSMGMFQPQNMFAQSMGFSPIGSMPLASNMFGGATSFMQGGSFNMTQATALPGMLNQMLGMPV